MEKNIPEFAWFVIGCLVVMIFLLNISLWTAWRHKNSGKSLDLLKKSGQTLRQPWQKEDEQLEKLASQAAKLREKNEKIPVGEQTHEQDG